MSLACTECDQTFEDTGELVKHVQENHSLVKSDEEQWTDEQLTAAAATLSKGKGGGNNNDEEEEEEEEEEETEKAHGDSASMGGSETKYDNVPGGDKKKKKKGNMAYSEDGVEEDIENAFEKSDVLRKGVNMAPFLADFVGAVKAAVGSVVKSQGAQNDYQANFNQNLAKGFSVINSKMDDLLGRIDTLESTVPVGRKSALTKSDPQSRVFGGGGNDNGTAPISKSEAVKTELAKMPDYEIRKALEDLGMEGKVPQIEIIGYEGSYGLDSLSAMSIMKLADAFKLN